MQVPIPNNEIERLEALRQYDVLDTPPEQEFDDLTHLAAQICAAPISAITLVDKERQWFKSRVGLALEETPRDVSFCAHAILSDELLIVPDVRSDERFAANPFVLSEPHIRFYAGVPLVTPEGQAIGTLCVLDTVPRQLDSTQQDALRRLARQAVVLLEARPEAITGTKPSRQARLRAERQRLTRAAEKTLRDAENLKTSEMRHRRLFEAAKDGILILDAATGQIEDVNPFLCKLLGYAADDLVGKQLWELGFFWDIAANQDAFRTLQEKEYIRYDDLPMETKEGQIVSVEFVSNVYMCAEKQVVQCNIRDISERKNAEEKLRHSEANLAKAQQLAHLGSWELDLSHPESINDNSLVWSDEVFRLFGYEPGEIEVSNENFFRAVHPEDRERIMAVMAQTISGGSPYSVEHRIIHRDGTERNIHAQGEVIYSESGHPLRVVGTGQDITERLRAADKVKESQRFLQSTLDALKAHIVVLDEDGGIVAVNKAWQQFSEENGGAAISCGVGANYVEVCDQAIGINAEEATVVAEGIRRVMAGQQEVFSLEYQCDSLTAKRWFNVSVTRFVGEGPGYIVIAHENITARKLAEVRLWTSEGNLAKAQQIALLGSWEMDLTNPSDSNQNPLHWSDEVFRIFGYEPGEIEVSYENFLGAVHPDDRNLILTTVAHALESGKFNRFDHRILLPDGTERIVHEQAQFLLNPHTGQPIRMVGTVQDITEQKRAEIALVQSNELLRAVTEGTTDAIYAKDLEGRYLMMNSAGANLLGHTVEEIIGKTDAEILQLESAQIFAESDRLVMASGNVETRESVVALGGVKRTYLGTKGPLRGPNGEIVGIVGISRDITERKQAEQALEATTRQIVATWESMSDAFFSLDTQWRFTHVNSQAAQLSQRTPEEMIGKSIWEEFPTTIASKFHTEFERAMKEQVPVTFEEFYGPYSIWGEVHAYPSPLGLSVYYRDITERKEAEAQLHFQKTLLEAQTEASLDGILVVSDGEKILSYNQRFVQMWGIAQSAMDEHDDGGAIQEILAQLVEPQQFLDRVTYLYAHREEKSQEEVGLRDGRIFDRYSAPISSTDGSYYGRVWYFRDITERKAVENELLKMRDELERRVEQRTAELAQANADLQIQINEREEAEAETRVRARQQEAVAELGRRALADTDIDTLLNGATALVAATLNVEISSILELMPDGDTLCFRASTGWEKEVTGLFASSKATSQAGHALLHETPTIVIDLRSENRFEPSPLLLEQGIISGITVIVGNYDQPFGTLGAHTTKQRLFTGNDAHFLQSMANVLAAAVARRRIETEIRQLNEQLKETNEQLRVDNLERQMALGALRDVTFGLKEAKEEAERAKENAEIANRAKSEFLSRMSHELRTPLNSILGFGQILNKEAVSPLSKESIGYILKGGQHLLDLINEVLDIARVEAGRLEISLEPVAVNDVVPEVCALLQPIAAERSIRVKENSAELGGEYILADRQRLKQVLFNLLSNAIKYNREGGEVEVFCQQKTDGWVSIAVRDTGMGISPQNLQKLFTPFERLGALTSEIEGTGLGLVLSQRLVTAMGGTLTVESSVGQGTTFTIELQETTSPEEQVANLPQVTQSLDENNQGQRFFSILCIEDNPAHIRLLEVIFQGRPEMTLLTAMEGSVGLEIAREQEPDLILLDLNLPDIHGKDVLARLQQSALTRDIPVVVISADATPNQVERLLAAGARICLTKPLDVDRFLLTLNQLFKIPPPTQPSNEENTA